MSYAGPIGKIERIQELDIIRGLSLFGVLLINLIVQSFLLAPWGTFDDLPTAPLDAIIIPAAFTVVYGKAMTLFSLLFGFGFAMMMSRLEQRGVDVTGIYVRRVSILLIIGLLHVFLLFFGDILHIYALMGFALLMTRRWSDRALLAGGVILTVFSVPISEYALSLIYDKPYPWIAIVREGAERRFDLMLGSDYLAYVGELWRMAWTEMWANPQEITYWSVTLGRFMLGAWIFRQGWLQDTKQYAKHFRRWSMLLIAIGISREVLGRVPGVSPSIAEAFAPLSQLIIGLGYGAIVIVLCQSDKVCQWFSGVASVGQMALTNYLLQSLVYFFVLFGFGLGLLDRLGGTTCLIIALLTFGCQMYFSQWWLARYRFGPVEWLWRSLTYRKRQQIRVMNIV